MNRLATLFSWHAPATAPQECLREELFAKAIALLASAEIVLDIGPGIRPQQYICPLVHICAEPFSQYVDELQNIAIQALDRKYVVMQMTWQEVVRYFPAKSVDTVIISDVIEHLEKEEGRTLLEATKRIARSQIGVFTTLGFVPQHHADGKDAWGLDGGAWQEHRSGWLPDDFDHGWQVLISRDFHLLDNMGQPRVKPEGALWAIFSHPKEPR
ncbi:MAG: class I SAM-dependent methyltransferase [Pirellulaceae bacterium]